VDIENRSTVTYQRNNASAGSLSCGQRLYYKGLKISEEKKRKANNIRKTLEDEENK
jgi:hypothetical protein